MKLEDDVLVECDTSGECLRADVAIDESLIFTEIWVLALVTNPEDSLGEIGLFASLSPSQPTQLRHQFTGELVWNEGRSFSISNN